jgi:hypothetical protein
MLDLIALAIAKRNKYHLLIFGDLCSVITELPKSLGALDNRRQRTAFESHNGRSALAAGTGAPARGRVKTLKRQQGGELFSLLPFLQSWPQRYSSLD